MCQLSLGHRRSQAGITQCLGTLKSDQRQPPGRPGLQSWHVDRRRVQWRRGWSSIGWCLEGHRRRNDDPHTPAVLCGPAEGHDKLKPARDILLPRHHLVSKVVITRCRPNGT